LGRSFFSPQGVNLYISIILRPQIPILQVSQITLVAGVAVAETIESFSQLRPSLKWPNDTLLNGRKVSGILTEMETQGSRVSFVIPGIGVNLNCPREVFPEELRGKATSIFIETGQKVDRAAFAAELLGRLEKHYFLFLRQGLAAVRHIWESYSHLTGKRVVVDGAGRRVEGKAIGLDEDGALVLEGEEGRRHRILAGDVTVVGGYSQGEQL
jgi:BirA family biotin operon repressor/biotin-[acetyl-CoA-carboxylase] ligase